MFKYLISFVFISCNMIGFAQSVRYNLKMAKPQNHYFQVEMMISDVAAKDITVKLPVWAPGSYLVRDFSNNLNLVTAKDENGKDLEINKTAKNAWNIKKGKAKEVMVGYEVYAFNLSVRTSFLDATHGFVSGPGVFMYLDGHKDVSGELEIYPNKIFSKITTAMPLKEEKVMGDGSSTYTYSDYDHLIDCPIEIGNQEVFSFEAAGVTHDVAMYGVGNYVISDLQRDMAKIVEEATAVFGKNPNKHYTFIIHNTANGGGGLEHSNSTVLGMSRWNYEGSSYLKFLSLVAHEYFHLWNVKRIRPVELGPFNYDEENYTSLLWVMEGFTSYYDELLLLRAGFYSKEKYMNIYFSTLNYVHGKHGVKVQPVAHASYDAWIKAYKPNENSGNTTISYYSKGSMMASILDATIINKTKGKKCLDHFMQKLYADFYLDKDRGFSEEEFKTALEEFIGENMDEFFDNYINGTKVPDYNKIYAPVGMNVGYVGVARPDVGISLKSSGGKTIISGIRADSPGVDAGLSVNDEIIGVNGFRIDSKSLTQYFNSLSNGETLDVLYSRDNLLGITELKAELYEKPKYEYSFGTGKATQKLLEYWLRTND